MQASVPSSQATLIPTYFFIPCSIEVYTHAMIPISNDTNHAAIVSTAQSLPVQYNYSCLYIKDLHAQPIGGEVTPKVLLIHSLLSDKREFGTIAWQFRTLIPSACDKLC
jgi:hypothetical protein